ncbi:MAG: hypothetical protein M3Q10_06795 [Chloroflexota bacterium]|nr:hypothetical protein [Chloroflexota bacterium]
MLIEDLSLAFLAANRARSRSAQFRVHWPVCLPGQDYLRVDDPWTDDNAGDALRTVWFGLGRRAGIWLNASDGFLHPAHPWRTARWASFCRDADAVLDGELASLAGRVG